MIRALLLLFFTFHIGYGLSLEDNGIDGAQTINAYEFYPYMVSISANKCGGAVIAKRTVLTAAHCIATSTFKMIYIIVGTKNLNVPENAFRYRAHKLITHPDYDPDTLANDIGLVIANRDIEYTQRVQPIKYAESSPSYDFDAFVIGWGSTRTNVSAPADLKYVDVRSVEQSQCTSEIGNRDSTICIVTTEMEGICPRDDGGPVVFNNQVVGVVSEILYPCGDARPQSVTRVSYFERWINENIER